MRIVAVRETTVALGSKSRNADIAFDTMTASAVCVETDKLRNGRPLLGLGFDSIGRYGHGGLLAERFVDRLLAANPEEYADEMLADNIDPEKAWRIIMRNEKLGGHGERAGAVGLLDSALWDLAAKVTDVPFWWMLRQRYGTEAAIDELRAGDLVFVTGRERRLRHVAVVVEEVNDPTTLCVVHASMSRGKVLEERLDIFLPRHDFNCARRILHWPEES